MVWAYAKRLEYLQCIGQYHCNNNICQRETSINPNSTSNFQVQTLYVGMARTLHTCNTLQKWKYLENTYITVFYEWFYTINDLRYIAKRPPRYWTRQYWNRVFVVLLSSELSGDNLTPPHLSTSCWVSICSAHCHISQSGLCCISISRTLE